MSGSIITKGFKMYAVDGDRTGGYFPRVNSYRFKITTGPRCAGMVSEKSYATRIKAFNAGERMLIKLKG